MGGNGGRAPLPYTASLDGLRAVAVVAVLLYHHDRRWMPGGWLGVSLFFTLSGFLIGHLLLTEVDRTGRVDLGAFWRRRVRRLLPASAVALTVALVLVLVRSADFDAGSAVADIRFAVLNVANWRFIAAEAPYAGVDTLPSPVQHYWSLAIEEQFYLVFPVVVALTARRRRLFAGLVIGAIGFSIVSQRAVTDLDRLYFGTDTRLAELAVGVGLALLWPTIGRALAAHRRGVDLLGIAALVATLGVFATADLAGDTLDSGVLAPLAVLWALLITFAMTGHRVPAVLGLDPLRRLGAISYGVYLFHWPVYITITSSGTGLERWPLLALRVSVTVGAAALSAWLVELPIRRRRIVRPAVTWTWTGAVVAVVVLATAVAPTSATDEAVPIATAVDAGEVRPVRIVVFGDSTSRAVGEALADLGSDTGRMEVLVRNHPGFTVLPYQAALLRPGYVYGWPHDADPVAATVADARRFDADAVVVIVGSAQLSDLRFRPGGPWLRITQRPVADRYAEALVATLGALGSLDVPIIWADVPPPAWELDAFGQLVGRPSPGSGEATMNDSRRVAVLNAVTELVIGRTEGAMSIPYAAAMAGDDGVIESTARADGLHLDEDFAAAFARSSLVGLLEDAYRQLRRASATAPAGTTWWDVPLRE